MVGEVVAAREVVAGLGALDLVLHAVGEVLEDDAPVAGAVHKATAQENKVSFSVKARCTIRTQCPSCLLSPQPKMPPVTRPKEKRVQSTPSSSCESF